MGTTRRSPAAAQGAAAVEHGIPFAQAVQVWAQVAINSFGGPAGQIAVMHRFLVEERRWISERRFLHALSYCMLLPGPEAQQLATYIGWLLHGTAGGLVAGILFIAPGVAAILALSIVYALLGGIDPLAGAFFGLQAAVVAVVAEAVLRIGRRALKTPAQMLIAALAFIAIFFGEVPFPLIVLAAGVAGLGASLVRPDLFRPAQPHGEEAGADGGGALIDDDAPLRPTAVRAAWRAAAIALAVWLVPVIVLTVTLGTDHVLAREAAFFSQTAVVTFGGAYAVLAFIAQRAVETYGWLRPGEMLTGLGMAETTPGPLIMVAQFVGFMAAYRHPGGLAPLTAGILGSLVTTWVTFAPCFFFIFAGAPYIERLRGNRSLDAALSAVTAAVVGVVLNLAVWFALNTAFAQVRTLRGFGMRLLAPEWSTVEPAAPAVMAFAAVGIFALRWSVLRVLGISALLGLFAAVTSGVPA